MSTIKTLGSPVDGLKWQAQMKDAEKLNTVKSLFVSNNRGSEQIGEARKHFEKAYMSQMQDVADTLPRGAVAPFMQKAMDAMDKVMARTFDRTAEKGGTHTKRVHRKMVLKANKLALESFKQVEAELLKDKKVLKQAQKDTHQSQQREVPLRPKVVIRNGNICVQRRPPMVETLVMRGGGAKGIANIPALAELEKSGSLGGVKHVVGTSAGALTALTLACGYDSRRLGELTDKHPMHTMAGKVENFKEIYPMVKLKGVAGQFGLRGAIVRALGGGPGQEAMRVADMASGDRVSEFLTENWNDPSFQEKLQGVDARHGEGTKARLELLMAKPKYDEDRSGLMITFKDLKVLSELAPDTFKELTLTGYDQNNRETVYFNAKDYPNMPVAVAGRISMSIPVAFQTVTYNPTDDLKGKRDFVDGGVGSNMPSEVVMKDHNGDKLKGIDKEMANAKTMLFTYAEKGKWVDKLHGEQGKPLGRLKKLELAFKGLMAKNSNMQKVSNEDSKKVYKGGVNTLAVHHYNLDTMDLQATELEVQMAQAQSTLMTLKHIELRQEQVFEQTFDSLDEALPYLGEMELKAIVEGGPPDPKDFQNDVEYTLELHLYKLAAENLGVEPKELPEGGGMNLSRNSSPFEDDTDVVNFNTGTDRTPRFGGSGIRFGDSDSESENVIDLDKMFSFSSLNQPKTGSNGGSGPKIEEVD